MIPLRQNRSRIPMTVLKLWILTAWGSGYAVALTPFIYNCVEDGGCRNGECNTSTKKCECDAFYSGEDCSTPSFKCPDGLTHCYNGGVCIPNSAARIGYHCDCFKHEGIPMYTGHSCETPTFVSCERHSRGDFSFCINGGRCSAYVTRYQQHVPCNCSAAQIPPGHEDEEGNVLWGAHCEVIGYSIPMHKDIHGNGNTNNDNSRLGTAGIGGIIMIVVGTISLVVMIGLQVRRQQQANETQEAIEAANQLTIEATEQVVSFDEGDLERPFSADSSDRKEDDKGNDATSNNNNSQATTSPKGQMGPNHTFT